MRTRWVRYAWLLVLLALLAPGEVKAQDYSFSVPVLKMQVYVQPDASVKIVYDITFKNHGATIDIVDIGMPNSNYKLDSVRASIDGVGLSDIRKSEVVNPGVEVHLGSRSIKAGAEGTLHVEFPMPNMVYQDTTRKDYASFRITPTWFDGDLVRGSTHLQIAIHMPEGVKGEELLSQNVEFTDRATYEGHSAAVWDFKDAKATHAYLVGVSFPSRVMTRVIKMTPIQLLNKFMEDNPGIQFALVIVALVGLGFLYFRFTGGTGFSLFVILAAGLGFICYIAPILHLLSFPVLLGLIVFNETQLKHKRSSYLPPIAQTEGGDIKRGLTAPEAAVLLELPLSKVLMLAIFGMLEKGVLQQVQDDPLQVKLNPEYIPPASAMAQGSKLHHDFRRDTAQRLGTVIHTYENGFLDVIESHPNKPLKELNFSTPVEALIQSTAQKMKGFDLKATQEYYRTVIQRALSQASGIGEIPAREQYLDKYMPWVMMNDTYPTVFAHPGYNYWPRWTRPMHHFPGAEGTAGKVFGSPAGSGDSGGRTSFGDVAASFTGWAETTMGGLAGSIMPGSMSLPSLKGGVVDLSGVDKVTGDIFQAIAESSSKGGGGGGGHSCACAGCACACACAGGGR